MRTFLFLLLLGLIAVWFYFRDTRQFLMRQAHDRWTSTRHNMSQHTSLLEHIQQTKSRPTTPAHFPKVPDAATDKLVKVNWPEPQRTFFVNTRIPHLKRYPCSSCHDNQMKGTSPARFQATHADIVLKHANTGVLQCKSCHNAQSMNDLRTPAGLSVSMNESHLLCASCHSRQAKDWAGGSHGKRETFWHGTRVIRTCTGCHNPHAPLFGKRWPKTYFRHPVQKRQQRPH